MKKNETMKRIITEEMIKLCDKLTNITSQARRNFRKKVQNALEHNRESMIESAEEFVLRGVSSSEGKYMENIIRRLVSEFYPTEKQKKVDFTFIVDTIKKVVEVKKSSGLDYKKVLGEKETILKFVQKECKGKADPIFLMTTGANVFEEGRLKKGGFENNILYNLPRFWKEFLAPYYDYKKFQVYLEEASLKRIAAKEKRKKLMRKIVEEFFNE